MKTIQVLLATYNGQDFLKVQIDSLIGQSYPHVAIHARDDGSNDETLTILESYRKPGELSYTCGENVGVKRTFDMLLKTVPDAPFYAYCDQDDVWMPDKLARAVTAIESYSQEVPVLYFSLTQLVDRELNPLASQHPIVEREPGFGNALVQNVVTGCTIVINHVARKLILDSMPDWDQIAMHDWWIYQVISGHGIVHFDPYQSVKYRQHGNNQVGVENIKLTKRIGRFLQNRKTITRQAEELHRCYKDRLTSQNLKILEDLLAKDQSIVTRLNLALSGELYRHRKIDNLYFKCLLILNRL